MLTHHLRHIVLVAALNILAMHTSHADDRQRLQFDGENRSYVVRAQVLAQNDARVPLVFVLHGGGGNAANAETMTGFTEKGRKEGFIVVYPEGSGRLRNRLFTWNAGHCCGYAMKEEVDDVGFINALIDTLAQRYPIDDKRIYVTGMSNGGMMTHRLGIELSKRIAAIAPVVATVFGDEKKPAHPVAALMINGMQDENVPHEGGTPGGRGSDAWDGTPTKPALDQAAFWAQANGCTGAPQQDDTAVRVRWQYGCQSGRAVELLLVKDNGHAWPGGEPGSRRGDKPSTSLNATDVIWDFFKAHPAVQ
jgi:polyhydroxybutyrate depolymerase